MKHPFEWKDYFIAGMLASANLICGFLQLVPGVCGFVHDDAIYIATAKALATGQGYSLINLPGSPPQTKYPVLYPALLSLIWRLWPDFPENLHLIQGLNLAFGAASIAGSYLFLRRWQYLEPLPACFAGFLVAISPLYLYFCSLPLSEPLFAFTTLMALWRLEDYLRSEKPQPWQAWLLGTTLSLPFLTKIVGFIFIPLGLFLIWRAHRPWLRVAVPALVIFVLWAEWVLGAKINPNGQPFSYYQDYLGWWNAYRNDLWQFFRANFSFIIFSCCGLVNQTFATQAALVFFLHFLVFMGGMLILTAIILEALRLRVLPVFLTGYLATIALWPWPPLRFLLPFLPLLASYLFYYLTRSRSPFVFRPVFATVLALSALIIVSNLKGVLNTTKHNRVYGVPTVQFNGAAADSVSWADFQALFNWIQKNTPQEAILASNCDSMIYLYTGRQGFRPYEENPLVLYYGRGGPPFGPAAKLLESLLIYKADYLVLAPIFFQGEGKYWYDLVQQLQQLFPEWLHLVYTGTDPRIRIFHLQGEKAPQHDRNFRPF